VDENPILCANEKDKTLGLFYILFLQF